MILNKQQIITINENCLKKAMERKRQCLVQDCKNKAINSHVIWKNGILKPISTNSHLMELNYGKIRRGNSKLRFIRTGINKILRFKGFCSDHDSKIFEVIEQENIDYSELGNQILVSVRAVFHERRKKENLVDWYECIIKEKIIGEKEIENELKSDDAEIN